MRETQEGVVLSFHPTEKDASPGSQYRSLALRDEAIRSMKLVKVPLGTFLNLEEAVVEGDTAVIRMMKGKLARGESFFLDLGIYDVLSFNRRHTEFRIVPVHVNKKGEFFIGCRLPLAEEARVVSIVQRALRKFNTIYKGSLFPILSCPPNYEEDEFERAQVGEEPRSFV